MSIDMYLGSSDQQASSAQHVLQNHINAYQQLQTALSQFTVNSPSLSGVTYQSAKAYSSQVLTPLLRASILLDEAIIAACRKLPSEYRSSVDSVDLRESDLVDRIARADRIVGRYQELINIEYQRKKPNWSRIQNLQTARSNQLTVKRKLEEKLHKLRAFHQSSPQIFSQIAGLHSAVQQGIRQSQQSWNASTKTFVLPPKSEMKWAEEVNGKWKEREVVNAYNIAIKKSENGQDLTGDDIEAINNYAQSHPNEPINQKLLEAIKNFMDTSKEWYDGNSTKLDIVKEVSEQLGLGIQRLGGLITILEGIKGPATTNAQGVSTAFVLVNKNGIGQAWAQAGSKAASFAKGAGYGLIGLGFGLGMYDDIVNKDKTVGQAIVHNGLSTGLTWGAGTLTTAVLTTFVVSNPVGWAAAGVAAASVVAGTLASWGFETAYNNNFLGLRDGVDAVGDWLDDASTKVGKSFVKGVEGAKNWVNDVTDSVGDAISGGLSALNPFD